MKGTYILTAILLFSACEISDKPNWDIPDLQATDLTNFTKEVLFKGTTDPMELAIAADGRVFMVERGGAIHMWEPEFNKRERVGYIPVYMMIEDGLLGLALDPEFVDNGWLYVFYAPADGGDSRLSRFTFDGTEVDPDSERILLEVPMQREVCCHASGSLAFGPDGTLYLSVGDNADHIDTAGGPIDERPGHINADGQFTAANTNDLRGKILRIKPEPDGTYSIPEGNLFEDDALHRPEIYIMGLRNAFRIAVDQETGWLYFADVGNGDPPNERGDWGWDEFNQAREPGNYGWPYLTGNNSPYKDYNYETGEVGDPFDPVALVNDSPNNTGARELPPAQPAMIWYTFGESEQFPELGSGGVNPMSGPVYRRANTHREYALPDYYIGKHFIYDWMRNWVNVVTLDENGDYESMEPFLPGLEFSRPMDMEVGPDGALYMIEWGKGFWGSNQDAQVVRVRYTGNDTRLTTMEEIEQGPGSGIEVIKPAQGAFFEYDTEIPYEVVYDSSWMANNPDATLRVRMYTGFDTNTFLVGESNTLTGKLTVTRDYIHIPDLHYTDRFALIEACLVRPEQRDRCWQNRLNPKHVEAEHTQRTQNASRFTYGIHPAERAFPETALTVMRMRDDSELHYVLNIADIETVTVRYKPVSTGVLSVEFARQELARIDLDAASGRALPPLPQIGVLDRLKLNGQEHLTTVVSRSVYEGWYELTLPLPDEDRSAGLILRATGEAEGVLVEIDRLEFTP